MLDELHKRYVGPTRAASLIFFSDIASLWLVGISLEDVYLDRVTLLLMVLGGLLIIPIGCVVFLSPFLDITRMIYYKNAGL